MIEWSQYASRFAGGIPYGDIISTVMIFGMCVLGLIVARWMYNQL